MTGDQSGVKSKMAIVRLKPLFQYPLPSGDCEIIFRLEGGKKKSFPENRKENRPNWDENKMMANLREAIIFGDHLRTNCRKF